jgi:hypothetical protein
MQLLFVDKARAQSIKGGRTLRRTCPECHAVTVFREVAVLVKPVAPARAFRCSSCTELFVEPARPGR